MAEDEEETATTSKQNEPKTLNFSSPVTLEPIRSAKVNCDDVRTRTACVCARPVRCLCTRPNCVL